MAVQDQGPLLLNVVSNFQPVTSRFGGAFCPRGTEEHSLFTNRGINAQTQFIMKQKHEGIRFIINSVPALKTVRENTAATIVVIYLTCLLWTVRGGNFWFNLLYQLYTGKFCFFKLIEACHLKSSYDCVSE